METSSVGSLIAPKPQPIIPTNNALKSCLILLLFFTTFLASMAAFALKKVALSANNGVMKAVFSSVSCFGAGVFLGTCLLDLLPDSIEAINKGQTLLKWDNEFPIAEIILFFKESGLIDPNSMDLFSHGHSHDDGPLLDDVTHESSSQNNELDHHFDPESHSSMRAILLVFALSLHAVFEGLSLVFGALFIHKTLIGFSLGIRLVQSKLKTITIIMCCAVFAGMVLIGGFFGLAVIKILNRGSKATASMVSGTLQAVACGTFLYITCFEILPHELNQKGHRNYKMICLYLGFFVIAFFIYLFPDSDDNNMESLCMRSG
uniref:Zinc transporter ZIP3 n=1 Tax=Strongyloides stercoralis TaxID=6248 RepID=A0A0K0DW96_STRER